MRRNGSRPAADDGAGDARSEEGGAAESGPCSDAPPARPRDPDEWLRLSRRIQAVAKRVPIIPSLSWGREVKERFLQRQGRELPQVEYPDRRAEFAQAERMAQEAAAEHAGDDPIDTWARETLGSYALAARMLQAVGGDEFGRLSAQLYGLAGAPLCDDEPRGETDLDLAQRLLATDHVGPLAPPTPADAERLNARATARELARRLQEELPGEKVTVTVSRGVAAKAIAGNRRIRIRRGATFTPREVELLVAHEGLVHIATTLNGLAQPLVRCLGRTSPRALRLQEGLAVFAEFMGGVLDLDRLRRLAERVVAIGIAQRGGDFLDVHRFFQERGQSLEDAYESARRVFRGGLPSGGAAFSKDLVYLQGLARVQRFLGRTLAAGEGAAEDLLLLFAGKLSLEDLDALRAMRAAGVLSPARHVPGWARAVELLAARLSPVGPLDRWLEAAAPAVAARRQARGRAGLSRVG